MYGNTWAVSPLTNATYYRAAAAIGGAGAVTLLQTTAGVGGVGYKVLFTSAGNSSGQSYTIVGHKVGTKLGFETTEVVTGPNATTGLSANYYDRITSITASGAMTGNQSIGIDGGSVVLPGTTRILEVHFVATGSAGTLVFNRNTSTGTEILRINTPALATAVSRIDLRPGILTRGSAAETDVVLVTPTNVTYYTIVCG